MGIPNNIDNDSVPEETKTSLLYDMFNQAVIRGIGNCTQTCQHVTDFLNSGVMPIALSWRRVLKRL
ncbi:MAG: hypothetical protein NTU49_03590 [Gammaproteobacteria bacterium]|nr:hypothetical protein [Gammaproteobacteria bacterium]